MRSNPKGSAKEWVAGVASLPDHVNRHGRIVRTEGLFVLGPDGRVLDHLMGEPGSSIPNAAAFFEPLVARAAGGRPRRPITVRVGSSELAEAIRAARLPLQVEVAPTPEVDRLVATLHAELARDGGAASELLSPEVDDVARASFFEARAALWRAEPWACVSPWHPLSVTIPALAINNHALSVLGRTGQAPGLVLFDDIDSFDDELALRDARGNHAGESLPPGPAQTTLTFEDGSDLAPTIRHQVSEHGWDLAAPSAYPMLDALDEDEETRAITARDCAIFEAIARALSRMMAERGHDLAKAWRGGARVTWSGLVPTHAHGEVEITLGAPHEEEAPLFRRTDDPIADLLALASAESGDPSAEIRDAIQDDIIGSFRASPEAAGLPDIEPCRMLLRHAETELGVSIASLDADDVEEIVFDVFPEKLSVDASEASWILDVLRAFFTFLGRAYDLPAAPACLHVLGEGAIERLETQLADTSNYGLAKSMVMEGKAAGFPFDSPEGRAAWARTVNARIAAGSARSPSPARPRGGVDKAAEAKKKNKAKAARKARRKGR